MLLVLGNALQGQGQTVAAIAQYRIALALRPADPDILNSLGGTSYDRAD
jgi:Flp pilus assembly protein TadD